MEAITHHLPDHENAHDLLQYVQRNDTSSCSGSEHETAITPGFRFHPTEEELVGYYLRRMLQGHKLPIKLIPTVDLYGYDPWELPAMSAQAKYEPAEYWYFFVPRSSRFRYGAGERPTRLTKSGYWKATGTDKLLRAGSHVEHSRAARHRHEEDHHLHLHGHHQNFSALRKTLVFYEGRAPRGAKTSWVMDEYRMEPSSHQFNMIQPQNADSTICRLRLKRTLIRTASTPASISEAAGSIPKRRNASMRPEREERLQHDEVTSLHFAASTCSPNSTPSADHHPSKHIKVLPCNYSSHSPQTLSPHEERPTVDDATASQEFSTLSQSTRSKSVMRPSSLQLIQELSNSACPDVRLIEASKSALWTPSPGLRRPEGDSSSGLYSPSSLDDLLLNLQSYDISNPNSRNQTH